MLHTHIKDDKRVGAKESAHGNHAKEFRSLPQFDVPRGDKRIMDLTYEECQKLRFNPDYAEFVCPPGKIDDTDRIPLLRDVLLDMKKTGTRVKIELKGKGAAIPVVQLVEELGMVDQCAYSSFDHAQLKDLRDFRPDVDPREEGSGRSLLRLR